LPGLGGEGSWTEYDGNSPTFPHWRDMLLPENIIGNSTNYYSGSASGSGSVENPYPVSSTGEKYDNDIKEWELGHNSSYGYGEILKRTGLSYYSDEDGVNLSPFLLDDKGNKISLDDGLDNTQVTIASEEIFEGPSIATRYSNGGTIQKGEDNKYIKILFAAGTLS
jgi:hypothetical protein